MTDQPHDSPTPYEDEGANTERLSTPATTNQEPVPVVPFHRAGSHLQPGVRWAWVAIAIFAGLLILLQNISVFPAPKPAQAEPETLIYAPAINDPVLLSSKMMLGAMELPFLSEETRRLVSESLVATKSIPDMSAIDLLRIGVLQGVAADPAAGLELFDKADERIARRRTEVRDDESLTDEDRRVYDQLFAAVAADIDVARRVLDTDQTPVDQYDLDKFQTHHGWFGKLLETFGSEKGRQERKLMAAKGARAFLIISVMFTVVVCAFVVGCVLAVAAWFANFQGHLHWRMRHPKGPTYLYAEAFAVFLASFFVLLVVSEAASIGANEWMLRVIAITRMAVQFALLGLCFYPFFRSKRPDLITRDIGWHTGKGITSEIFAGVLGYFAGLPIIALGLGLMLLLMSVVSSITGGSGAGGGLTHPIVETYTGSPIMVFVALVFAVVWAPFVEETMFRGCFFTFLRTKHGFIVSALLSSFVFAAIHPQGWMSIPALGSVGYVLAMIREWRGSLIAPMVAHALHNATLVMFGVLLFRTLM